MTGKILISGGRVFFGQERTFRSSDILIGEGQIERVADRIVPDADVEIVDASGKIVSPGLIDFHMHAFRYGHFLSVDVDDVAPGSGTTTFVDAGSAGTGAIASPVGVTISASAVTLDPLTMAVIRQ